MNANSARRRRVNEKTAETRKSWAFQHTPHAQNSCVKCYNLWLPGHPDRQFSFVADSLYTGESVLRYVPANVDMIGAVHPNGALYEPAPAKRPGRGGPRKKGKRLPTRDDWAASRDPWTCISFDQFGLHGTFETKTRTGLYYKAGKDRMLKFILTRDMEGDRPTQIFYCTNLTMDAAEILSTYAHRWAIEVTHHDAKQLLGLEDPANRVPLAVQRTAPMAMFLYSLTILWYHKHGHKHVRFPERPWYTNKSEPSFADMLTTLRRVTWEEKLSPVRPKSSVWKKSVDLLTYLGTLAG